MKNTIFVAFLAAATLCLTAAGAEKAIYQTIDFPGASATMAFGINARGEVVGVFNTGGADHGFVMSGGVYRQINSPFAGTLTTQASGISARGMIVGAYQKAGECTGCPDWFPPGKVQNGYILSSGKFEALNVPGASYTYPVAINASGDIVGEYMISTGKAYAFIYSAGTFTTLDMSASAADSQSWSSAYGINAQGDMVGWYGDGNTMTFHGWVLRKGQHYTIDGPGSAWTLAMAINDPGEVVSVSYDTGRSFVWSAGVLNEISVPGAAMTFASGINDRGDVVGYYADSNGKMHGFILFRQ